jgi:hypothetical protein
MSSTTSSESGFFSSPRRQQQLLWASGAVLVIGIAVFLAVFLSRGGSQPASAGLSTVPTAPASTTPTAPRRVSPSPAALKTARTFLETAVLRKNLDVAYPLVGPNLKGGMTRAQWRKGNIAVTFYPARNIETTALVVKQSQKNHMLLLVELTPQKGSGVRPLAFYLGLDRIHGKWLVNYWLPDYSIPVKANPYN